MLDNVIRTMCDQKLKCDHLQLTHQDAITEGHTLTYSDMHSLKDLLIERIISYVIISIYHIHSLTNNC